MDARKLLQVETAAKDHTQYQEWLIGQYLNEIDDAEKERAGEFARLEAKYAELEKSILLLRREIRNHPIERDQTNYRDALEKARPTPRRSGRAPRRRSASTPSTIRCTTSRSGSAATG